MKSRKQPASYITPWQLCELCDSHDPPEPAVQAHGLPRESGQVEHSRPAAAPERQQEEQSCVS